MKDQHAGTERLHTGTDHLNGAHSRLVSYVPRDVSRLPKGGRARLSLETMIGTTSAGVQL
jgi:cobalamin biosynthesis protein CobD/CbiB